MAKNSKSFMRAGRVTLHWRYDLMFVDNRIHGKITDFKKAIERDHNDLFMKHRIKSKLDFKTMEIRRIIDWSTLLHELQEKKLI